MKKTLLLAVMALILIGFGCASQESQEEAPAEIDRDAILLEAQKNGLIMGEEEIHSMTFVALSDVQGQNVEDVEAYLDRDVAGWSAAALADVTGGGSFGLAYTQYEGGLFTLIAKMGGLPEPAEGYFYEGWLVRRGEDLSVVSTGKAVTSGVWFGNVFLSSTDLSDHDFFVLTLEPDDGNPAPAEHILEGSIK